MIKEITEFSYKIRVFSFYYEREIFCENNKWLALPKTVESPFLVVVVVV